MVKLEGLGAAIGRSGVPIAVLARRARVSRNAIYQAKAGKSVELGTAIRLARGLDVPLAEISEEAAKSIEAVA